jgi:LysM repeat protein
VWRSILVVFGIVLSSAAASNAGSTGTAELTIEARTGTATSALVFSSATLQCGGTPSATGFLRNAAKPACAAVRRGDIRKVAARQRKPRICTEGYAGPQSAQVTGTVDGRRVDVVLTRADGCGTNDWDALLPLLGEPERIGRIAARSKAAAPTTSAAPLAYQVQPRDTLTQIARRFHTSVAAITSLNQLSNPDALAEGQSLMIPPPSPARIVVTIREGSGFGLTLLAAQPSESVTFDIVLPDGSTYTGSPHAASAEGTVTATYDTAVGQGVYRVTATGGLGTNVELAFHVDPGRR